MPGYRRRSVPEAFRDLHDLSVHSRYYSRGAVRGSRVYRAGGTCSCGERWGLDAGKHNYARADVIRAHKDHVVYCYEAMLRGRGELVD